MGGVAWQIANSRRNKARAQVVSKRDFEANGASSSQSASSGRTVKAARRMFAVQRGIWDFLPLLPL